MNKIYLRLYAGVLNTQNEREMFGQLTQILIKWYITIDHGIISTDQWKDNRIMTCQWSKDWKLRVNQYHHFTKRCTVTPYFNDKDMGVAYDEPKGKIFSKREKKKKKTRRNNSGQSSRGASVHLSLRVLSPVRLWWLVVE